MRHHEHSARFAQRVVSCAILALGIGCSSADFTIPFADDTGSVADTIEISVVDDGVDVVETTAPDTTVDDARVEDTFEVGAPETALDSSDMGTDAFDSSSDARPSCDAPVKCFADKDGDGYASATDVVVACVCPKDYVAKEPTNADCDDGNPAVHPGVTTYQEIAYCPTATGCTTKSYDYDCSTKEDPFSAITFGGCAPYSAGCGGAGWSGSPPGCGDTGDFITCSKGLLSCDKTTTKRVQGCR